MNNFKADNSDDNSDEENVGLVKKQNEEDKDNQQNDDLDLDQDAKVTVRIKTMDDQEKRIEVILSENVLDLKNKIFEQMQIPLERQRLIYLGKQLKDNMSLFESKIKDDVCILLVANRVQNSSEPPRRQPESAENAGEGVDLSAFIFNALNETAQMRRNRRLLFQQNARSFLRNLRLNVTQSRETIVQNLISTELLLNSRKELEDVKTTDLGAENSMDCFNFEKRELKIGQWVDVKDTINQWLEAQVVDISNGKVYVHYNGWGTRWDEWIEVNSPRIEIFRTHTIQAATSTYLSPFPNSPPDSAENVAISIPSSTSIENLDKLTELSSKTLIIMKKLKTMKTKHDKQLKIQREMIEEECKRKQLRKKYENKETFLEEDEEEKIQTINPREEKKEEVDADEEDFEKKDLKQMINENAQLNQQIIMMSAQLAPIMDRVGRAFTDYSPHLLNNVNLFNNAMNNDSVTEERLRRHRTQQPRGRQRNRSMDSGELSSDSLSRHSNNSENSNNDDNDPNSGAEIRTRLRSISNTISRIRSSISSMRSLIFNNLGRADNEGNLDNEARIDERGDRRFTVNAQIPIISSPGDIASVHNIFDRFVDRQMVNVIGGEGAAPRNRNRNEPTSSNNESNNTSNESSNTDRNNPSGNVPNINAANNVSGNASNVADQRNLPNRREAYNNPTDYLMDMLGEGGNGLGLLNSLGGLSGLGGLGGLGGLSGLGGLGGPGGSNISSDTIELHIHAFMPNRGENTTEQQRNQVLNPVRNQNNVRSRDRSNSDESDNNSRVRQSEQRRVRFTETGVQTMDRRSRRRRDDRNRERDRLGSNDYSMSNSSYISRDNSPRSLMKKEATDKEILRQEMQCQTNFEMIDQSIQFSNPKRLVDNQTQTTDHVILTSTRPPTLEELNRIADEPEVTEQRKIKTTLKSKINPKIKKKRSIISKASIKRASDTSEVPSDIIFSPGDKRTSSKIHESTMKKSNTMTSSSIQTRPVISSGNASANRFLFRGNEEFHNTAGRSDNLRQQLQGTSSSYLTRSKRG